MKDWFGEILYVLNVMQRVEYQRDHPVRFMRFRLERPLLWAIRPLISWLPAKPSTAGLIGVPTRPYPRKQAKSANAGERGGGILESVQDGRNTDLTVSTIRSGACSTSDSVM